MNIKLLLFEMKNKEKDEKMIKETLERMLKNPYIKNNLLAVESIIKNYEGKYDLTKYRKIYETLKLKYEDEK